jgi:hypothetical protein
MCRRVKLNPKPQLNQHTTTPNPPPPFQGMNDLATPFFVVFLCSELGIVYAPKTVEGVDEEVLQRVEADT